AFRGGRGMLNSALNFGPGCSVAAVEELTGVQIDHFMELDFEGFIAMVDALDGVPVCLPEALDDPARISTCPPGSRWSEGRTPGRWPAPATRWGTAATSPASATSRW